MQNTTFTFCNITYCQIYFFVLLTFYLETIIDKQEASECRLANKEMISVF